MLLLGLYLKLGDGVAIETQFSNEELDQGSALELRTRYAVCEPPNPEHRSHGVDYYLIKLERNRNKNSLN